MNLLGQMLMLLSQRIEEETKDPQLIQLTREELVKVTRRLSEESNNYERVAKGTDPLIEMVDDWTHRFGMPHRGAEAEDQ